jgi:predicted nucleic acid-binding protein
VLLRAFLSEAGEAREWVQRSESAKLRVRAPDVIWLEVAHTLRRYVRAGLVAQPAAARGLAWVTGLPIESMAVRPFASVALARALETALSAYDACYLVLAEAADAVLVTADRRLAEAAAKAELIA